jgi:hypothetical protein
MSYFPIPLKFALTETDALLSNEVDVFSNPDVVILHSALVDVSNYQDKSHFY